ncbi:MAG: YceI family protein [Chloroflexi bacterium]|nr:YceI family protein [Chloroflexota bacterium]
MWKKLSFRYFILMVGLVLLAACGGASATAVPPTNTPQPEPTATAEVESETDAAETDAAETDAAEAAVEEAPTAPDSLRTFLIDPVQSTARYRVNEEFLSGAVTNLGKELGFFTAVGQTQEIEGELQLMGTDTGSLGIEAGQFSVQINTLQSDDHRRDDRIREKHLESSRFPLAEFTVTGVEGFPESYTEGEVVIFFLSGDMTIREITNQETFTVTAALENGTIIGLGVTQIFMVDYGFDPPNNAGFLRVQDPAMVEIELVAVEGDSE